MPDRQHHRLAWLRDNWYRDIWLFVISLLLVYTAIQVTRTVDQVKTGRRLAIGITCGATNAIINAGHDTIRAAPRYSPKVERNLVRIGLPSYAERKRRAERAANAYGSRIAGAVARTAGPASIRVVRLDGTLDCERFRQVTGTQGG